MARKKKKGRAGRDRVSDKISVLMREGDDQRQAVAKALSMERAGRLRKGGVYVRKVRSKRRHAYSGRG